MEPLISRGNLGHDALQGRVAVVTGAGSGIGFEAARSLLWLGAGVVIAELDQAAGDRAATTLAAEWSVDRVLFVPTDVGDEASVAAMAAEVQRRLGSVEIVIQNAGYFPVGPQRASSRLDLPLAAHRHRRNHLDDHDPHINSAHEPDT